MRIQVVDRGAKVSSTLRAHVKKRIALALGRFAQRVERVVIRFSKVAGEKRCLIEVSLRAETIRIEGLHDDGFAAVDHAISRASSSVDRALERQREARDGG